MKKLFAIAAFLAVTSISLTAYAKSNYNYTQTPSTNSAPASLQGSVVYVPVGVTVNAVTSTPISSETLYLGSGVSVTFPHAFAYNGKTIAPAGSTANGTVTILKKAGRANHNGQVMVRFSSITTPYGSVIPISAVIKTDDYSGILKGGTAKDGAIDYAKDTGIGAGSGAVLGTALGALSGGSVGQGAIYGTAIGAGLGVAKATIDKGKPVEIPANSSIEIYFDQPVTISSPRSYGY